MKISSQVRNWLRQFLAAIVDGDRARQDALFASLTARDFSSAVAAMDEGKTKEERELLCLVANLRADGIGYLRKHSPVPLDAESDEALIQLRDELRQIWSVKQVGPPRAAVLGEWFGDRDALLDPDKWTIFWQFGIIRPRFFRGELAWAYCRHHASMAECGNPECPAPFFLANRRSQRYCCANDECTRYAARLAARRYWTKQSKKQGKNK